MAVAQADGPVVSTKIRLLMLKLPTALYCFAEHWRFSGHRDLLDSSWI
jgi:hypothetical protein